jgi:hypothetical protein
MTMALLKALELESGMNVSIGFSIDLLDVATPKTLNFTDTWFKCVIIQMRTKLASNSIT